MIRLTAQSHFFQSATNTFFSRATLPFRLLAKTIISFLTWANVISGSGYAAFGYSASFGESQSASFTDPFGFNAQWGYYLDREHGYYLCGHRYYGRNGGRWLTRDPIGVAGGVNLYSYCVQGPVGWRDPNGFVRIGDFEFNCDTVFGGMRTGVAALGSAFSFGHWDGGSERDKPGFGVSKACGEVARECLIAAGTMGAGEAIGAARAAGGVRNLVEASEVAAETGQAIEKGQCAYTLVDEAGVTRYVGRTNDLERRFMEHGRDVAKEGLQLGEQFMCGSREEARILEQRLIEQHGGVNGGQLLNKINSIAQKSPLYPRVHP